jgi:hypothetical protein
MDHMTFLQLVHLGAMGLTFLVWAFFMFQMLFRLSRRSIMKNAENGGGYFAWVGESLRSFRDAATSQEDRSLRLRILWSGLILMILIGLGPVVAQLGR